MAISDIVGWMRATTPAVLQKKWQELIRQQQQSKLSGATRRMHSWGANPSHQTAPIPRCLTVLATLVNFHYDLYIVDDNSLLDDPLLGRLKLRDQFQGALHELFVEATCLGAGFTIIREDEREGTRRHVGFVALHKATGQHVLVEAKSRHRAGVISQPGTRDTSPDFRFRRLINDAVTKDPTHPLAIFIDTNLPPDRALRFYTPQSVNPVIPSRAIAALIDRIRKDYAGTDPYNLFVLSNHPQR